MTTIVFLVHSRNQDDFVVIINDKKELHKVFARSALLVVEIIRKAGITDVEYAPSISLTTFNKQYKNWNTK